MRASLKSTIVCCTSLSVALVAPVSANAQGATGVVRATADTTQTDITVGTQYTQVLVNVQALDIPSDDNGRKQLGRALLSALGLGNKTRSLTISAVLTQNGQPLPEVPLVTYSFDGNRRVTDLDVVSSYLSPRWQLGAADVISVKLNYKFSEQATYSPAAITENVTKLIPSDAIVSTLGAPFIQGVAGLAGSVFAAAETRAVSVGIQSDLLPYRGAVGARALTYALALPDGRSLGTIKASLVVSPTLARGGDFATLATANDLARKDGEDVAGLSLNVGGSRKNLLQEAKGLSEYSAMTKAPTPASVRDYCNKANGALAAYGLTPLDRTTIVYRSLTDGGFDTATYHPTANTWRTDCFVETDRTVLTRAISLSFTPAPEPVVPPPVSADKWPRPLKNAMGCWITGLSGDWCQTNAPDPRATLETAFASQVEIGVMDLPGIDLSTLPVGRKWDEDDLLTALRGQAQSFACYELGLILLKDGVPYNLGVTMKADSITALQVLRAPPEAAQCLPS